MTDRNPVFTAVQENATSFLMDWPVMEADESHFEGTVFVLDETGSRISDTPLPAPGDRIADEALTRIGWSRVEGWHPDSFGRRTSRVAAAVRTSSVRQVVGLPEQRSRLGSLAEEASLHLS